MARTPIALADLFRYYKGLPHQMAAISMLAERIPANILSRESEWFKVWSQSGRTPEDWLKPAMEMITRFEGLRLEAYPDPASGGEPWTIGYGTTSYANGEKVKKGDRITTVEAESQLQQELTGFYGPGLLDLIPTAKDWKPAQIAAILSWAYNVGLGAVAASTLRMRINGGGDPLTVVREELPRWDKADGKPMEGLALRRAEEVKLFAAAEKLQLQQDAEQPIARVTPSSPFTARLTPNIRVGEFALDQEVRRFERQHQVDTAGELAAFLERVRRQFGKPVMISSGYRPPVINASVGGASASEHLYDTPGVGAVDFYIEGVDIQQVQDWCDKEWPYSLGYGAPKGFVHLGIRKGRPKVRWDY
jgi:GH24 family phage-related lysozyme (muramidase)